MKASVIILVFLMLTSTIIAVPVCTAKIESSAMGTGFTSSFTVDPPSEEWILVGYASGTEAQSHALLFYNDQTEQWKLRWQMVMPSFSTAYPSNYKYHVALVIYRDLDKDGNLTASDEIIGQQTDTQSGYGAGYQVGWIGPFDASVGGDWSDVRWLVVGFVGWTVYEPEDSWWKELFTWQGVIIGIIGIGIALACIGVPGVGCVAAGIIVAAIGVALSFPGLSDWQNEIKTYDYAEGVLGLQGPVGPGTTVSSSWLYGRDEGNDTLTDDWPNAEPYDSGEYVLHTTVQRFNKIAVKFSTPQHGSIIMSLAVNGLPYPAPYIISSRSHHEITFEVELDIDHMLSSTHGWLWHMKHTPDGIPILEFDLIILVDYEIYDYDYLFPDPGYPLLNQRFVAEWKAFGITSQATGVNYSEKIIVHIDWLPAGVAFLIRDWILQISDLRPYYFIDLNSFDIVILSGEQPELREEMLQKPLSTFDSSAMQQNPYGWTRWNETSVFGALIDPDGNVTRRIASEGLPTVTKRITVPDPNNTIVYAPELHDFALHVEQGPVSPLAGTLSIPSLKLLNETGIPTSITLNITHLDDPLKILSPLGGETNAIYLDHPESASLIIPKLGNGSVRIPGSNRATEITLNATASLNHTLITMPDSQTTTIICMPNVLGSVTISLGPSMPVRDPGLPNGIPYDLSMLIDVLVNETIVSVYDSSIYDVIAHMNLTSVTTYSVPPFGATGQHSPEIGSASINHTADPSHTIARIDLTHYSSNDDEVVFYTPGTISSCDNLSIAGWITRSYQAVEEVEVSSTWGTNSTWTLPHGLFLADFDLPESVSPGTYNVTVHFIGNSSDLNDDKYSSTLLTITSDPTISNVHISPESPTPTDLVNVYADVEDDVGVGPVNLYWKTSISSVWTSTLMSGPTGNTYEAGINSQPDGTIVQFYVNASDGSNFAMAPSNAPIVVYNYVSAESDSQFPQILEVKRKPMRESAVTVLDTVQVYANITDNVGIEVVCLYWKTATETQWHIILMRPNLESWYMTRFAIPEHPLGTEVECIIRTSDHSNNTAEYPESVQDYEYLVTISEDINGDGFVELSDFFIVSAAFGTELGQPGWDPRADLNDDEIVELFDFFILSAHFGWHL